MKFLSFFAGIGGIDLGLERAGHKCVGQCEINPFALRVLAKHWPDVPRFGDIREINPDELPEADLWCGGFPCQDISQAGKREGINGPRSGLFFDWWGLVCKTRPRYVLMENTPGVFSRGLGEILSALASGGYDAEWQVYAASDVGAPHIRERFFLLAYPRRYGGVQGEILHRVPCEDIPRKTHRPGTKEVWMPGIKRRVGRSGRIVPECAYARVDDGLSTTLDEDRMRCLGNAVVPQVAEYIGRLLQEAAQ